LSELLAYFTYLLGFLEALLDIGAVYFAYRLTRLAGTFRAWILLITALLILASHGVASLIQVVTQIPFQELVSLTEGTPVTSFLLATIPGLLLSSILFSAMFELHGRFRQLSK
jgi:hypothetical protein